MTLDAKDKGRDSPSEKDVTFVPQDQEPSDSEVVEIFTAEDVATRHSKLDKENAELRKYVGLGKLSEEHAKELEVKLKEYEGERFRVEFEAAKTDPDALASLNQRYKLQDWEKRLKDRESQLAITQLEHKQALEQANIIAFQMKANEIASQHGIDIKELLDFEPTTPEQMEKIAKKLAAIKGTEPEAGKPTIKPDSGLGTGAGVDFSKMTAEEKITYALTHKKK